MRTATALLVPLLLAAACGTRLPDSAFEQASQTSGPGVAARGTAGSGTPTAPGAAAGTSTSVASQGDGGTGAGTDPSGGGGGGGEGGGVALLPNQASDVGITETTITLGNITAENGVLGDAFAPAARGLRAWVQAVNAAGGIYGRSVDLKTCDDREDRSRALECARRLVEQDQVFALVATNTRALGGAAQYLNDQGVPVIGFPITNSFYRYPHFWGAYPQGYPRDGTTVGYGGKLMLLSGQFRWFKENLGVSTAAVFSYDIDESKQAGNAFVRGLELEGYRVLQYTVSFAAPSFDLAVSDMQKQGVQIIFDAMDDGANRKLCDSMSRRPFSVKAKVSTVVALGDAVGTAYNDTCRNSVFAPSQSIPYTAAHVPAVAEFRDAFAKYQPGQPFHQWALEAWGQGTLVADALTAMGPAPTRAGLEDFLRGMQNYTANGIFIGLDYAANYEAATAEDCIAIARWLDDQGGWVLATNPFPFCYPDAHQFGTPALEQGN